MMNKLYAVALCAGALAAIPANAQTKSSYPVADKVAAKVIAKYEDSSCAQLAAQKQQPKTAQQSEGEQKAMQLLKQDPQMRAYFINKIAAPIANKMFECGMIP